MNTITYLTINVDTFKILNHANYRSQAKDIDNYYHQVSTHA